MASTTKTWFSVSNRLLSSTVDGKSQYRELFYNFKELFLSGGWTITMSAGSGGLTAFAAGAGDRILHPEDVVYGTDSTQNLSYFVAISPAGWLSSAPGNSIQFLAVCSNVNTDTTPDLVTVYATRGQFFLHSSPNTNRPRASFHSTNVLTTSLSTFVSTAPPNGHYYHTWRTSDGDIIFTTALTGGIDRTENAFWLASITGANNGEGQNRFVLFWNNSQASFGDSLIGGSRCYGILPNGMFENSLEFTSFAEFCTGWTLGLNMYGNTLVEPIELIINSPTDPGYVGQMSDVAYAADNLVWGSLIDGDTDPVRLTLVDRTWIPTQTGSLPISGS